MPSEAKKGRTASETIISPVAQLLKENLPGRKPKASRFDFASGNRMMITGEFNHTFARGQIHASSSTAQLLSMPPPKYGQALATLAKSNLDSGLV
jgi:hypothetical protein